MIDEIHIKNVALIKNATCEPSPHFTVITGETGAGKTALLTACKLLMGGRADASLVRQGASELAVEGRFFFDDGDVGVDLDAADADMVGTDIDEDGLVVARRVTEQGRSRVTVQGMLSTVGALQERIGSQIDLCSQHEHQRLLDSSTQRALLDAWGGQELAASLCAYQDAFADVVALAKELERLALLETQGQEALDRARYALEQIERVNPTEMEYDELLSELPRYEHAEVLMRSTHEARNALLGADEILGALDCLETVMSSLDAIASIDTEMKPSADAAREAFYMLDDVARTLAHYEDTIDFSPTELEEKQMRLADLQLLMRGFGPRMEDVFTTWREAQAAINEYAGRDEFIAQTEARLAQAEEVLVQAAHELAALRAALLPRFLEAINTELARLDMGSAQMSAEVRTLERGQWTKYGSQTVTLLFAPGKELAPQPLSRIASGGELSRVMLAIKVVLGAVDKVETLIFDEIDAGVGGQTALSLGSVLADLATTHQVIVVTHLAQVAVRADKHYVVRKSEGDDPETTLSEVEGESRVDEIARMLSGSVDEQSRAYAVTLLSQNSPL